MASAASTAILDRDGEWTSESQAVEAHHTKLRGIVFSDQAGTLNVEQSLDDENWDLATAVAVEARKGAAVDVALLGRFWRLRYVNSSTRQGAFRVAAAAKP